MVQKERKQLGQYKLVMNKLFSMKGKVTYEKDDLNWTQNILVYEPKISFVWSFRRKVMIYLFNNTSPKEFDALCHNELDFVALCLSTDPKAYPAWNHRFFVLSSKPSKEFDDEFSFINKCLKYDCRNFHCWNYRRDILELSKTYYDSEIGFTICMIQDNFNNFSAWHHRSVVITREQSHLLDDPRFVQNEIEVLHNAIFTDPDDHGTWSYYRWLLSQPSPTYQPTILCASVRLIDGKKFVLVTVKHGNVEDIDNLLIKSAIDDSVHAQFVKKIKIDNFFSFFVYELNFITAGCIVEISTASSSLEIDASTPYFYSLRVSSYLLSGFFRDKDIIKKELIILLELLELEPQNKLVLLSVIELMSCIDIIGYRQEVNNYINKLKISDPLRKGYYTNMQKWVDKCCWILSLPQVSESKIDILPIDSIEAYKAICIHLQTNDIISPLLFGSANQTSYN